MEQKNRGHMDWAESPIVEESETDFSATFCRCPEDSNLEVMRLCEMPGRQEDEKQLSHYWDHGLYFEGELHKLAVSLSCALFFWCNWTN